jgi:hypothetical protein
MLRMTAKRAKIFFFGAGVLLLLAGVAVYLIWVVPSLLEIPTEN